MIYYIKNTDFFPKIKIIFYLINNIIYFFILSVFRVKVGFPWFPIFYKGSDFYQYFLRYLRLIIEKFR